jgi:phosphoglycolate phosphatase-like HAD superfamily hydrolase
MQEKKFGVFDFDGTIVDTMPVYFAMSSHIIEREYGLDGAQFEEFSRKFTGMPTDEIFIRFLTLHGKPIDRVQEHVRAFFELVDQQDFPLIEGAEEAIRKVYAKGFELFISTGSQTAKTKERLEKAGLLRYFSLVYGSSEIEKGPEHIDDFARYAYLSREDFARRAFFLGDGPGDMKLAKICRMKAIGVAHTFEPAYLLEAGADLVLGKIREAEDAELL